MSQKCFHIQTGTGLVLNSNEAGSVKQVSSRFEGQRSGPLCLQVEVHRRNQQTFVEKKNGRRSGGRSRWNLLKRKQNCPLEPLSYTEKRPKEPGSKNQRAFLMVKTRGTGEELGRIGRDKGEKVHS